MVFVERELSLLSKILIKNLMPIILNQDALMSNTAAHHGALVCTWPETSGTVMELKMLKPDHIPSTTASVLATTTTSGKLLSHLPFLHPYNGHEY
jgi:hypothetical protein